MTTGATIIIYCYDTEKDATFLLTGKESKYVTDLSTTHPEFRKFMDLIKTKENFIGENLEEAKTFFSKEARNLEKGDVGSYIASHHLGNVRIHYDTPIRTTTGFHVKYRFLPTDFKRGIIKGGKEESESSEDAILREVREEVGMNIPKKEFKLIGNCRDNDVFSLNVAIRNIKMFENAIASRFEKRSGEVFDLQFKPLFQIEADILKYNAKSRCAIELFKSQMPVSASVSSAAASVTSAAVPSAAVEEKPKGGKYTKRKNKKSRKGRVKKASKRSKKSRKSQINKK
jgi:8-oxo-dGTP pyrophosphatase MutT (NUDIX family)